MLRILGLLIFIVGYQAQACKPRAPKIINLYVDSQEGERYYYDNKRILEDRPSVSLNNCRNTALSNRYIMLGLGLENLVLTNDTIGYNFTPERESYDCKLTNNPFKNTQTKDDRYSKLTDQRDFFNRCVVIQVTELNEKVEKGLVYPQEQPGCKLEKKSKWSVDFTGAYCFFKPQPQSNISVHVDIRQECRNQLSLSEQKTVLADYNAILNTYIAGNATGFSQDLTALSTTDIRLSYNPVEKLIPTSDNFGEVRPSWPTEWKASDIFMGSINVTKPSHNYDEINVPLIVNAICPRECVGNLCSSSCDYSQPVVGEFNLYEIVNGKEEFIKLWYDGSVSPAQYQGLLTGMGVTIPSGTLQPGKQYVIKTFFKEPDLDYAYFSGRVEKQLRFERNYIGPLARGGGQIGLIPEISEIGSIGEVIRVPTIRNLSFDMTRLDGLSRALLTWQSKLDNVFWPPYYENMCDSNGSCLKANQGQIEITQFFTLSLDTNDNFVVNYGRGYRQSNVVTNDSWNSFVESKVDCGINTDDDDDFDWGDIL